MARKQYRGVMVADFEVDGSFQTVARLEQLWKEAADEIQRKLLAEVPEAKISASGSSDDPIQAELQDRRGSTGDIKNIVFRGGRGKNEKMSRSQMMRLEELWKKRWYELNLNSDPRADLKGEDKKLYNKLNHMATKEGYIMDESLGRLRNKNTTAMAYANGSVDHAWRFANKVRSLELKFSYDPTDDERHGKIMRKIMNGEIDGLEQDIFHWEMQADQMMPDEDAAIYRAELGDKWKMADKIRGLADAGDKHLVNLLDKLPSDALNNLTNVMVDDPVFDDEGKATRSVNLKTKRGNSYSFTINTKKLFELMGNDKNKATRAVIDKIISSKTRQGAFFKTISVKDANGNPANAEEVFTAEGLSKAEIDKLWQSANAGGSTVRG